MKNSEKKGSNSGDQKIRCPEGENNYQNWIPWIEYMLFDILHEKIEFRKKGGQIKGSKKKKLGLVKGK